MLWASSCERQGLRIHGREHFGQMRQQPWALQHPVVVGGEGLVVEQRGLAQQLAQGVPLPFAGGGDEHLLAAGELEHVIDRPGADAVRHRRGGLAGHGVLLHVLGGEQHAVFVQRALHLRPTPVTWRSLSAASTPMAPNMPPMMSFTELPARNGRPTGPVM